VVEIDPLALAWLGAAEAAPADEWAALGLHSLALETARGWATDLAAAQQPGAPRGQQSVAPTLQQLLGEVRVDPAAFQARANSVQPQAEGPA